MDTATDRRVAARARLPLIACAGIILACTWLLHPYEYMTGNHALQLPIVLAHQNHDLFPNDPLVQSLDHYSSLYWQAVARLSILPNETLLGIIYLLTAIGGLAAAWLLASSLAPKSTIAPWAAVVAFGLGVRPIIGGGTISSSYPEQTSLAMVFFVLMSAALALRKPFIAAALFAIGFLVNQMYGIHVGLYVALFIALSSVRGRLNRRWLIAAAMAAVVVAPVSLMTRSAAPDIRVDNVWAQAVHSVGGPHFYLLDNAWHHLLTGGVIVLTVFGTAWNDGDRWRRTLALSSAAAAAGWITIALLLGYMLPPSSALMLQAPRGADLFWVFGLIYLLSHFLERYEEERRNGDAGLLHLAGAIGLLTLYRLVPAVVSATALLALAACRHCRLWLRRAPEVIAVSALSVAMLTFALWQSATDDREWSLIEVGPSPEMQEVAAWARESTAVDATFMVSPVWEPDEYSMFRPLSQRSVFVTQKDLSAIHWDTSYLPVYLERMAALGAVADADEGRLHSRNEIARRWEELSDEHLSAIALEYGIDFAVFGVERGTTLPVVFQNRSYKVAAFRSSG